MGPYRSRPTRLIRKLVGLPVTLHRLLPSSGTSFLCGMEVRRSAAYSDNATASGKWSYRRIAGIRDGNGDKHEEPKTGTGAGEKEELEFEFRSKETATALGKRRRSAAIVAISVSSAAEYRGGMVGRITADLDAELIRDCARRRKRVRHLENIRPVVSKGR
jgi:hypothetical protein